MLKKDNPIHFEIDELAILLKAMSHPTRLWILQFLASQHCCFSGEIAEELPIARSTISEHLKQLKDAGIIQGEIEHPKIRYCINTEKWERLKHLMDCFFVNGMTLNKKLNCNH